MQDSNTKIYLELLLEQALGKDAKSVSFSIMQPPDSSLGDYASNVVLARAKMLKQDPAQLAAEIIPKIKRLDTKRRFSRVEFVRGFLNFFLEKKYLEENLQAVLKESDKYGRQKSAGKGKILIDYFQPNIAKPLHLGHLRTAVIGDAIFKILTTAGRTVESDTHLGDWGTQFGLLITAYKLWGDDKLIEKNPIAELNKLYVRINQELQQNPRLREQGKAEFVKLERHDKENRKLWKRFYDWSWKEFEQVYTLLKIRRADHNWGESFYEGKMAAVVKQLKTKKLLQASQGAQVVDLAAHNLGVAVIIKSDGGTTYLLRDLAAYIYRKRQGFGRQLYVVDVRQKHTLAQTFKILELLGYITAKEQARHIDYGYLSLPEGAFSTRTGNIIGPVELLNKTHEKILQIISEKNPNLTDKETVAWQVAVGAIKYFDLSHNLKSDIVFRWEEVLDFEGNTGPYLQYTHARIKSILRKAGKISPSKRLRFQRPEEWRLLRQMAFYPEAVGEAAKNYFPHYIANYLYKLASDFNLFYQRVQVLPEADKQLRNSRLLLISGVAQVLKNGLDLLGVEAPEEM